MKKFIFHQLYHDSLKGISDEHYGRIVKAISEYVFNGVEPQLDGIANSVWLLIQPDIDKGINTSRSRAEAGEASGKVRNGKREQNRTNGNKKEKSIVQVGDIHDADVNYKAIEEAWRRHTWRNAHKEYPLEGMKMTESNQMLVKIRLAELMTERQCGLVDAIGMMIRVIEKAGDPSEGNPIKGDEYADKRTFPVVIGDSDIFIKFLCHERE